MEKERGEHMQRRCYLHFCTRRHLLEAIGILPVPDVNLLGHYSFLTSDLDSKDGRCPRTLAALPAEDECVVGRPPSHPSDLRLHAWSQARWLRGALTRFRRG